MPPPRAALLFSPPRFVCARCLRRTQTDYRLRSSFHNSPPGFSIPTHPQTSGIVELSNRTLISLSGQDAPKFLQGLTTNNVDVQNQNAWYTGFLEAHGRILWDAIIYPQLDENGQWACLIEVDADTSQSFVKHLSRHKLRSKVQVRSAGEDYSLWAVWDDNTLSQDALQSLKDHLAVVAPDPRLPILGLRLIQALRRNSNVPQTLPTAASPLASYTLRRYLHGVAEGPSELPPSSALPQESNLDYLHGVDFRKGCYVGQELTIRTQHTGVVRKRVLPVQLYGSAAPPPSRLAYAPEDFGVRPGADIKRVGGAAATASKRSAGRVLAAMGNVGLALCRLEVMTDVRVSAEGGSYQPGQEFCVGGDEDKKIVAFVPAWLRERLDGEREKKGIE